MGFGGGGRFEMVGLYIHIMYVCMYVPIVTSR